jgi:23S rRNA (guanosine2251-2'-O)-methyltransferase
MAFRSHGGRADRHPRRSGGDQPGSARPSAGAANEQPRGGGGARGPERPAGRNRSGGRGAAPDGSYWLYGQHPVEAALENGRRRLRRLLLTEEAQAALTDRRGSAPLPLQPERIDRNGLDALLGRDAVHQGMALLADPLTPPPLDQVLAERAGPVLLLDQVTDPRNVGAILRSAAAFGVAAVIVQDRNAPEETGTLAKAASGALERVPLLRAVNLSRTLVALKAAGLWTVGLDAGGGRLDGGSFAGRRVALVLGAEGEGLRRLTRETCDEIAGLVMPGAFESLNVSNAAAVALYELVR